MAVAVGAGERHGSKCLEIPMARLLYGVLAAAMLTAQQAAAAPCPTTTDQQAFDIEALKSELMVLATGCHDDAQYNAFIRKYQPDLMRTEDELNVYFKREFGRGGQQEHDSYITSLANAQSDSGVQLGSDFCPRNGMIFNEVMALQRTSQLPEYAAAKDLVPVSLGSCVGPVVRTTEERHAVVRRVVHTTRKPTTTHHD
jgi:hypothetical protein